MSELILKLGGGINTIIPLVDDALRRELQLIQAGLDKTKGVLREYESKYNMNSETFYKRFLEGELGDEYIDWAGEYEIFQILEKDFKRLKELKLVY